MREARNNKARTIRGVVNLWEVTTYYNQCMTVAISAQVLAKSNVKLLENPVERTKAYAELSPPVKKLNLIQHTKINKKVL